MLKVTALITFAPDAPLDEHVLDAIDGAADAVVATVVHGASGGHLAWHLLFDSEARWRASGTAERIARLSEDARIAGVEAIAYVPCTVRLAAPDIADAVHRTLLVSVDDGTPASREALFFDELAVMPVYIDEIRNAALGRSLWSFGRRRWTHVWEQEFATLDDLTGPYMRHPYHWGHVDRWFDAEAPERIVDADLCHSASVIRSSVIARYR